VVTLRDGRSIAYAEWGRTDGTPVVLFHGMPGSRLFCPDEEETERAGVRLITIDRPGYGMSSPHPGRTLLDCASDYVEWAAVVRLPPCPIVGWSAGGPYALACAVHRPDRVTSVALAASPAPLDEVPSLSDGLPDEVRDLMTLVRSGAPEAVERITARCQWFAEGWETIFDPGAGTADDALLAEHGVLEPARAWVREGARQGSAGYVEDWIADALPWGFSPRDVSHDVHVWWGDDDQFVVRDCAEYLAHAIKRSTLTVLASEGHMFPVRHWAEILAALH
jgi:pimeloyl-ACP methyl ester carboxylesterase